MRVRWICGAPLFLIIVVTAGPAFAQGSEINDEVKKAVERSVGSAITLAVSESVSRTVVSEEVQREPTTTVFGSPFYNRFNAGFSFGSFQADTFGGTAGVVYKAHDIFLLHATAAGSYTSADVTALGTTLSINSGFADMRLGGNLVFLNTEPAKAWLTVEGGANWFTLSGVGSVWSWLVSPALTASLRAGPILFEPRVAFFFTDAFGSNSTGTTITMQPGFSLKYRGEQFRPQLNFSYAKVISPNIGDDGFISVGPELLYAITPSVQIGGAYSYGTSLNSGVDVNSHTAMLEFRWIF